MGFAVGAAGLLKGAGQPQAALLGAGLLSDKGTWVTYLGASNYTLATDGRWLFGAELYSAEFKQFDYYLGEATSNDSSAEDATVADAREAQYRVSARYILPLGAAKSQGRTPMTAMGLVSGIIVSKDNAPDSSQAAFHNGSSGLNSRGFSACGPLDQANQYGPSVWTRV